MSTNEGFEEVLRFWFSSRPSGDHAAMARQMEWWFRGGADSEIVERFPPLLDQAKRGELDSWSQRPRSRLALIIVLDQFSRTIHRGSAQAFAQDPKALTLALEGIENGHYAALDNPWEKTFFFLPSHPRVSEPGEGSQSRAEPSKAPQTCGMSVLRKPSPRTPHHRRFGRHPHRSETWDNQPPERNRYQTGQLVHTAAARTRLRHLKAMKSYRIAV
jgi:uncharacterized protein (DUF924 family)